MAIITIVTPEEFKQQREAVGLTQAELAGMVGVHPVTIARWETEMRRIPKMAARLLTLIVDQKRSGKQKQLRSKPTKQSKAMIGDTREPRVDRPTRQAHRVRLRRHD